MMSQENLSLFLLISILSLNTLVMTSSLQKENYLESDEKIPALLRGIGLKGQKNEIYHQVPRLLNSSKIYSQINQSYSNRIHFAQSQYSVPGWVDTRWKYRKNISILPSQVFGDFIDFPVLIELFDEDLRDHAQVTGNDIFFTNEQGVKLDHEIELYDRQYSYTQAHLVAWMKTNLTDLEGAYISMYYGNPSAGVQENPTGVWNTNYVGVWHLSEDPTEVIHDSTSNTNDGTSQGSMTPTDQVEGKIDGSIDFDGDNDYIDCGNDSSLDITGDITLQFWVKAENYINDPDLLTKGDYTQAYSSFIYDADDDNSGGVIYFKLNNHELISVNSLTIGTWYYITCARESNSMKIYIDGDVDSTDTYSNPIETIPDSLTITRSPDNLDGILDEVRVSYTARSENWIKTEYANQYNPISFYTITSQEESPISYYWPFPTFKYRTNISIDSTKVFADLTNFTVLIDLNDSNLHDQDKVQTDGDDIMFAIDSIKLDHDIETFDQTGNGTHAHLIAWVRVPNLSGSTNTTISMYYGNNAIRSQENPEGVWDSDYGAVWHLNDDFLDSSSNNNNGTNSGSTNTVGKMANAQDFDGVDDDIDTGSGSSMDNIFNNGGTISAWIYPTGWGEGNFGRIIDKSTATDGSNGWGFCIDNDGFPNQHLLFFRDFSISRGLWYTPDDSISLNQWQYVVVSYDDTDKQNDPYVFINALSQLLVEEPTPDGDSIDDSAQSVHIGNFAGDTTRTFDGIIDEVRISHVMRSADWVNTEYYNQFDPANFYSIGEEEEHSRWWADASFTNRRDIVIKREKVSTHLTNFPVLIDITSTDFKQGEVQADGKDIMFTDDSGSILDFEVEYFSQNVAEGHLITWIRLNVSNKDDTIVSMYYSNDQIVQSQETPAEVWDSNYVGIWHLQESLGNAQDSTSYGQEGVISGGVTQGASGFIDGAYYFDGVDCNVSMGDPSDGHLDFGTGSFTVETWINRDSTMSSTQYGGIFKGNGDVNDNEGWLLRFKGSDSVRFSAGDGLASVFNIHQSSILVDETWMHFVGVLDRSAGEAYLYKDGQKIATDTATNGDIDSNYLFRISEDWDNAFHFKGLFDEVRLSNIARSSDWITTEYQNQYNPTSFYSVGSEVIFDTKPPIINDFGVDDPGTGAGKFWADVSDSTSDVQTVKITINETEYSMSQNASGYWIYQMGVVWQGYYKFCITNASDSLGNYIQTNSSLKTYTFTYDLAAPDVFKWKYTTSTNTFRANVSDGWGEVDTVIVNVTDHSKILPDPATQIMHFYQDFGGAGLGYINDTLIMANGDIEFKIFVNDTSGNSFLSSAHPGVVWVNHAPIAENLTLSPSPLYSNETLVLKYDYDDEDNHGESGTEIRWYKNGVLQASFNDSTQIDDAYLIPGDDWNVTVRPKDGEKFGEINTSLTVTVLNTPPVVQVVTLNPITAYTTSTLSITNTTSDHENDDLSYYIEWYWNSQHNFSYDNLLTITPDKTTKGESWHCRIRAFDGTSNSSWLSSAPIIIQNTVPQAVNLTITPDPAYTNDILVASWDMADADGDAENKSAAIIYWYKYGDLQPLLNNCVSINPGNTSKDHTWFFRIQVFDGTDYSALPPTQSGTITISNSVPIAQNVSIIQPAPLTTDDLQADWDYLDIDNDNYGPPLIKWYTNSSGIWQHQSSYDDYDTLPASATTKGQYWCFGIQVYDQDDYAAEVNSSPVLILNTPPEITNLELTSTPTTTVDLVATWESNDNDSDSLTFYVTWYLNGLLNATLQTSSMNSTLTSGNTTKGQEWSFNVTAYDGEINSSEITLGYIVSIQNSIPTVANPTFNETSPVADEKGFNITYGFADADGDSEVITGKLIVYWYVDWAYNSAYNNNTEIHGDNTTSGQVWSYIIRVYDGEAYSANVSSAQGMMIGSRSNDPPYAENLTINPSTPKTYQSLTATFDYADNDSDPQYGYEIRWYMNGSLQSDYNNQLTVPASATLECQQWNFSVKVFDGIAWGIFYNSSLYTILNSPPEVDYLDLTANPTTVSDLVASWTFNDNDSDSLTFNITWYLNGIFNGSWSTTSSNATLNADNTTKTDRWSFTLQAFDGEEYSSIVALGYNVTILNTAPVVGNLTITTNPTTSDDLVVGWDYDDLDDDPRDDAAAFIVWYLNGESIGGLTNTSSVLSGNTTKNQVWWYTVRCYDGQAYSLPQESPHAQIQNSAPVNVSSLPLPSSPTVETGLVLVESAILSSLLDADGDDIQFIDSIRWFKDSTLQSDLNGSLTVPGSRLKKGETWSYTVVPSDSLDTGSICTSGDLLILNSVPTITLAYFAESDVKTTHNLTVNYLYADADGENVSVSEIRWYRSTDTSAPYNYYLVPSYNGSLILPNTATNKGERWKFDIKITDGYNESTDWILSDPVEIKNSRPWVDPFSISITGGMSTSDPLSLTYSWYDDDYPLDNETGTLISWANSDLELVPNNLLTLSSTNTKAGQRWWVTITPNDGEEGGVSIISWYYGKQITIGNTPPVITEANIQGFFNATTWYGTSFGTNFDLVINYTVSDIDQDEGATGYGIILVGDYLSEAEYIWFRNRSGAVTQVLELKGETSVPFYNTEKGDVWWAQIRPRDLYGDYGLPVNSTQIIIGNTAPQVLNLQWDQTDYRTADNLSFSYDFFDFDPDDTEVNITIHWFLNGTYSPLYDNQRVISFTVLKKGQTWRVECMVYDGEAYSIWFSLPIIIIKNTLPVGSSVLLLPFSPTTAEHLMAAWNYSDIDGDLEQQARILWYRNSVLQPALNDALMVHSGNTSKSELWYYTIEVFDGENYSVLVTSPVITIINTAPTLENISFIMINPNTTLPLEVDWTFLDIDGDTESTTVIIRWFKDGVNQSALADSRVVASSFTAKGEVWNYTVQVFDGQAYSIVYSSITITIDNAIPSIGAYSYEFNQTQSQVEGPDVRNSLTKEVFYVVGEPISISYEFMDPDLPLDSDQSRIYWYYYDNRTSRWVEELLYRQNLSIPSSGASPGDCWRCTIIPSDGLANGPNITFPVIIIESNPLIHDNSPTITALTDIEGHYKFYLTATDLNNITTVEYLFTDSAIDTQYAQRSSTDNVWFLEFQLPIEDFQSYLGTNLTGSVKVISTVAYDSQTFKIYTMVPFTFEVRDEAPPRVVNPRWMFNDDLAPTNITFYTDIIEYGSEITDITLYYYFRLFEGTESPAVGIGASLLQSDTSEWRVEHMTLHNTTGGIPTYSITVPFDHNGTDREILYKIITTDSAGNSGIAYDIERDDPDRIGETRFTFSPPGIDPTLVLVIVGITVLVAIFGSIVYVRFIRKPELVGLDKELVLKKITEISEVEVMATLDSHTIGVVVSFFDQRHGPIPIIVIPEILKDNFSKLVDLSDRSFSGTGFCDDFNTEIPSSYDFVLAQGLRTSVMSFGFALERPTARGGQENLTCNILIHQEVFPLVESFKEEIKGKIHSIHKLMNKEDSDKNIIRSKIFSLRKFVSSVVMSYERIYGTTELIIGED